MVLLVLSGCGGGSSGNNNQAASAVSPTTNARFSALAKETHFKTLRTLRVSNSAVTATSTAAPGPTPFTASGSFALPVQDFSFQVSELFGTILFHYGFPSSQDPPLLPAPQSFASTALIPTVSADEQFATNSLVDGGITLTLRNDQNQDSYTFAGPPSGSNVTYLSNDTVVNADGTTTWDWFASITFASGWALIVGQDVFFDPGTGFGGFEQFSRQMWFVRPNLPQISIDNPTVVHGDSAQNTTTLNFQINTTNNTLNAWSVAAVQNGTTLKSFAPTVDIRGPGVTNGSNPLNVSLTWDGVGVTGNFNWVVTANTTNFVAGGPVNDGVNSTQVVVADTMADLVDVIATVSSVIFDPGNTTTSLSGTVTARNTAPTNVKVQVSVKDSGGNVVKTYPIIQGAQIQEIWDGRDDNGNFRGYGEYTYVINATSDQGSKTANVTVDAEPPLPELSLINFTHSAEQPLLDDNGNAIGPIYYQDDKNGVITENPVVIIMDLLVEPPVGDQASLTRLASSALAKVPVKDVKLKFRRPQNLLKDTDYEITVVDAFGSPIKLIDQSSNQEVKTITFKTKGNKEVPIDCTLELIKRVQKIKSLDVKLKRKGSKKLEKSVATPDKPIYITLNPYKPPLKGKAKAVPTQLMDFVTELAQGAKTDDEARNLLATNIYTWLPQHGFLYEPKVSQAVTPGRTVGKGANTKVLSVKFNYKLFISSFDIQDVFRGDCADISAFYTLCCAAVGVDSTMRFVGTPVLERRTLFWTLSCRPLGGKILVAGRQIIVEGYQPITLGFHVIGDINGRGWDPIMRFGGSFGQATPAGVSYSDYDAALVDKPRTLADARSRGLLPTTQAGVILEEVTLK